ncbi:hypothetical protein OQA88_11963 [Cercophora sp. LCS_1]
MASANPRIRIREATRADAAIMTEIQFAAFGTDVINQLMFPTVTEDAKKKHTASVLADMTPDGKKSSETILMVAELLPEDASVNGPGEVVSFGKWILRRQPVSEGEWSVETPVTAEMLGEGSNVDIDLLVHPLTLEGNTDLKTLVSVPNWQRLGAGSALVRWGNELADSLGLASYLEASPYGYSVYKRLGFEDVDVLDFDMAGRWGAVKAEGRNWGESNALELGGPLPEGSMRTVIMKRTPSSFSKTSP